MFSRIFANAFGLMAAYDIAGISVPPELLALLDEPTPSHPESCESAAMNAAVHADPDLTARGDVPHAVSGELLHVA